MEKYYGGERGYFNVNIIGAHLFAFFILLFFSSDAYLLLLLFYFISENYY